MVCLSDLFNKRLPAKERVMLEWISEKKREIKTCLPSSTKGHLFFFFFFFFSNEVSIERVKDTLNNILEFISIFSS